MLQEATQLMVENEFLIDRRKLFQGLKYIIVITPERAEETQGTWEGKLNHIKSIM